ncbi:MAG TPA: HAD-IIIC family phosphatase [Thermoanaerobaculia bacterium]|nr:HAD-IIIC family phosphatase [Thermoanaerobaculia bacterium]
MSLPSDAPSRGAIESAARAKTRDDLRDALAPRRGNLTLLEVARLVERLSEIDPSPPPLKIALVRGYSTELLRPYWELELRLAGFRPEIHEAPLGAFFTDAGENAPLARHRPEVTYFLLRWEDVDPAFGRPVMTLGESERDALADSASRRVAEWLAGFRASLSGPLVVSFLAKEAGPELGLADANSPVAERAFRERLKTRLVDGFRRAVPSAYFFDMDELLAELGRENALDPRLWYSAGFPFSVAGAQTLVRRLVPFAVLPRLPPAKCLVLDADNTLWGGIVGEAGIDGIALGPEYPGSAFVAFQRRLLDFRSRGFLLAVCSRNNPADVYEVLDRHPNQILRRDAFAAFRIGWEPKSAALEGLAAELGLGLDSLVFADDSPQDVLLVRQQLPSVTVRRVPAEPARIPACLDDEWRLETLHVSAEDRERTELYVRESRRRSFAAAAPSFDDYLRSLEMAMTVAADDPERAARIAQLTAKTNQFNLTLRRHDEAEIRRRMEDPDSLVAHFSLADVFGDSGVVGVAIVTSVRSATPEIDTFLMSCRVIGRRAETAFLRWLVARLAAGGAAAVRARFVAGSKNALVADFWRDHGFLPRDDGGWELPLGGDWERGFPAAPVRVVETGSR